MKAFIQHLSYYLPELGVSNEELNLLHPEWDVEKIKTKTGISNRYTAAKNEFASDMAVKAAFKLFDTCCVDPASIDFLLYCTQSPDYFLPTTACIIQDKLGLPTSAGALDYNLGCSGYVYGLALAKGLVSAGIARKVLLITSETYSKFIHAKDKSNQTIFGDAASATIISTEGLCEIGDFDLGTDGKGANNLIVKEGAMRHPERRFEDKEDGYGNISNDSSLYMNGPEIFSFTSKAVPLLVNNVLKANNTLKEEVDIYIFHQANQFMLEHLRKKIGIPSEKFFIHIENCGNTVSSTIPIALKEAIDQNKLTKGMKCILAGFGVGYSWGGTILIF